MEKNKEYDAVKEMRTVREELSERYWKNPELLKKEMEEMQKKYGLKPEADPKGKAA